MSKLFRRTLFLFIVLFGLVANATSIYSGWVLHQELTQQYRSKAISIVKSIASSSAEIFMTRDTATIQAVIDQYIEIEGVFYIAVEDRAGEIIAHTFHPQIPNIVQATLTATDHFPVSNATTIRDHVRVTEGQGFIDVSAAILGGLAGGVHVGMDTHKIQSLIWGTILRTQAITFVIFLVSIVISYFLIRSISNPIAQLHQYAQKVAAHDFSARLDIRTRDEIGALADAMRSMSAELNTSFAELETEISERLMAEYRLAAEKELLSVTLRSIAEGVVTTDRDGRIATVNRAAEKLLNIRQKEACGQTFSAVFDRIAKKPGARRPNPVDQVLETGRIVEGGPDLILYTPDNTERHVIHSAAPIMDQKQELVGAVMVLRDQTERIKLQSQMLRADKLESVGLLAGGIAHDFNNILSAVMGNIELAQFETSVPDALQEPLDNALKAARRARDLTQQLLTFSRGGAPVKQTTSVVELVKDSAMFALRGSNIQCQLDLPDSLWAVEIDAGQISQVVNNLVINAMQAMPDGGRIHLTTANATLAAGEEPMLPAGRYVKVAVTDEGGGIAEELRHKVIDPYFSTKAGGSGLGLAVAYSVIRHHGGHIDFESEPGVGTTFYFFLQASKHAARAEKETETVADTGEGRLLVMDDEEMILRVASGMLSRLGYRVACARNGQEAIRMYRQASEQGRPFDAVIMDLTIPGQMGGRETIQQLKAFDPGVKAIVSSGYSNDPVMANYRSHGFCAIVAKPYRIHELGRAVQEALTRESLPPNPGG